MNSTSTSRNIAGVFFLVLVMTVSVLAVDLLFLLLFDFLGNVDALISIFFYEGLVMLLVGTAGWGFREHELFAVGWKRAKIYHVSRSPRYPNFWLAVALAGLLLIFIDLYFIGQRY